MRLFALIGWPLGHSFSKKYFSEKFEREGIADARFELLPLEDIREFPELIKIHPDLRGLSVTIPHKQTVMPFLDELDPIAVDVGAVNCIRVANGRLKGFNTDVIGFELSLKPYLENFSAAQKAQTAFILGTGGASKAVAYVLRKHGISFQFVSRNSGRSETCSYADLEGQKPALIINCTPVGTFPNVEEMPPAPLNIFHANQLVYDLIYNPAETLFLREARQRGSAGQNGMEMLQLQAEAAWEIWNSPRPES